MLKLCPIIMTSRGVERSSYYGKGDDLRAPGIWEPGRALGDQPPPRRGQGAGTAAWVRHTLAACTPLEGASGRLRRVSGDAAASAGAGT